MISLSFSSLEFGIGTSLINFGTAIVEYINIVFNNGDTIVFNDNNSVEYGV